ncbi:HlyD family efflux transporter periplasmic adaptor subunit [Spirillospora sp. NPDC047279]|uniref:efflux RND transporter periplasmic adaptor subunit n=1 Tax=Spirillospora sp. NPDC047279 TaxID=3155478 RepID=UPI0033C4CABC
MKSPFKRRTLLVNGALGVLLAGGVGAAYLSLADDGAAAQQGQQRVSRVTRGTVESTVSASGAVASSQTRSLSFGASGTVSGIAVKVGEKVSKGETLARLDQTASLDSLKAAQLSLDAAAEKLDATSSSSASYAQVYSSYVQAKNSYRSAQQTYSGTVIKAPFAGTVTQVNGNVGDSSSGSSSSSSSSGGSSSSNGSSSSGGGSSSTPSSGSGSTTTTSSGFIELVNTRSLEIEGDFTEADTTKLKVGQEATITFDALSGTTATGEIKQIAISPTTSDNVVSYPVTIALTDVPSGVRIGQTATVEITTGSAEDVLYVPTAAVRTAGGQSTVTAVENGAHVTRTVTIGIKGDQGTEIKSGLKEGDQIVVTSTATTTTGNTGNRFPGVGGGGGGPGGGGGMPGGGGGRR